MVDETRSNVKTEDEAPPSLEVAVLGGGCFWCLEAVFEEVEGVESVRSGYAGGHTHNPTYEEVCRADTGHAEVVEVTFNPAVIGFRELLEIFFLIHDPTTPNRQGNDVGPQYRSIILYRNETQREIAEDVIRSLEAEGVWPQPIVTELVPLTAFYPAEAYHTSYYRRNPMQPYCQVVIAPKVVEFRRRFADKLRQHT